MDVSSFIESRKSIEFNIEIPAGSTVCFVDSSFNPPHNVHAMLARLCRQSFPDSFIIFMLATGNADKPTVPVDQLQTRTQMIDVLVRSEFPHDGKVGIALTTEARFIDKAAQAQKSLPPGCVIVFALGFDTLVRLADQKYYTKPIQDVMALFFQQAEVIVLTREGDSLSNIPQGVDPVEAQVQFLNNDPLLKRYASKIHIYESTPETDNVSSTRARSSKSALEQCVPPAIAAYVENNNLYNT